VSASLAERLSELVRPAIGLGALDPVAARVLGRRPPAEAVAALAEAGRAWRAGRPRSVLQALERAENAGGDCAALRWLRSYALDAVGRARAADESAHAAMELFSEPAPQPLLGRAAAVECARRAVDERTLAILGRALAAGRRPLWALTLRAETQRDPAFNRYPEAVADLRRAVALAPGRGWVWAHLGRALDGVGDEPGARAALDKAAALSPRSGWIFAWRGQFRVRRGIAGSREDLERACALDPSYPFSRAWRGGALRRAGLLTEAEAELRAALELLPCYEWTHQELFLTLKDMGRPDAASVAADAHEHDPKRGWCRREDPLERAEALKELALARRSHARDPYLRAWEAWTALGGGDLAAAGRSLGPRARREPAFLNAVRGEAALRAGRALEAAAHYGRAVATRRAVPYLGGRGLSLLAAGDARGAERDLAEAVRRYAPTAPFVKGLAGALCALGRTGAALQMIDRALRLTPRDRETLARKAEILYRAGRTREALACLADAGWSAPSPLPGKSSRARAWAESWRGADLRARGLLDSAEAAFRRALRADASSPLAAAWLGECLSTAGRRDEAVRWLCRAVALAPRWALARQWRGEALLASGRPRGALADFRAARRLDPGLSRAALGEAAALEALGRAAQARRALAEAGVEVVA
jgi:tetratricopeptide (TPR) repeat protein